MLSRRLQRMLSTVTLLACASGPALAQTAPVIPPSPTGDSVGIVGADLESLLARARAVNPAIQAGADRVEAARAATGPAGILPDPMLSLGLMNQMIGGRTAADMTVMSMRVIGIGQTLPFPGKLALQRRIATAEVAAAEARLEAARREVEAEVKTAFYELAFVDRALEIVDRNAELLANFTRVTEARYGVGTGAQADVLKARVESARLAEEASALTERRRAALARLNAALDRPSDAAVAEPAVPERIARAAVPDDPKEIRFTSAALGSRASDSPLPPLAELQQTAVVQNPELRAQDAEINAQAARAALAGKAYLPDFNVSLQYGQRDGRSDLVSAMVSVPLPLHRGSKQDLLVKEAEAELSALRAERQARANEVRAEVAKDYADLERARAQLALYVRSILPQGQAALQSSTASFGVGRADLLTLLNNQATLFRYETDYHRALSDFATQLAQLERVVGTEILP